MRWNCTEETSDEELMGWSVKFWPVLRGCMVLDEKEDQGDNHCVCVCSCVIIVIMFQ